MFATALTGPGAHEQPHGGQLDPGAQVGQAQAQVPASTQPFPPPLGAQSHLHGKQDSPGAQVGQVHVQVPPAPPPEQSHSAGGQFAPAGQATGLTHAQPHPLDALGWQKPPLAQSAPNGHSVDVADQAQLASA
jgi:hypothetical protein